MTFYPFASAAVPTFTSKTGAYFQGTISVGTSATLGNNTLRVSPLVLSSSCTLQGIGAEFTAAGDAASLFQLALYADDGTGYPGALVSAPGSISTGSGNAGTVATGGTPGVYLATGLAVTLPAGLYWAGGAVQGVTVSQPTLRTGLFISWPVSTAAQPTANQVLNAYTQGSVSAAPPNPFQAFSTSTGVSARIVFQLA